MCGPPSYRKYIFIFLLIIIPTIIEIPFVNLSYNYLAIGLILSSVSFISLIILIIFFIKVSTKNPGYLLRNESFYFSTEAKMNVKK